MNEGNNTILPQGRNAVVLCKQHNMIYIILTTLFAASSHAPYAANSLITFDSVCILNMQAQNLKFQGQHRVDFTNESCNIHAWRPATTNESTSWICCCYTAALQGPGCAVKVGMVKASHALAIRTKLDCCFDCVVHAHPNPCNGRPPTHHLVYHLNSIIIKVPPGVFWRSAACAIAVVTVTSWPLLVIV